MGTAILCALAILLAAPPASAEPPIACPTPLATMKAHDARASCSAGSRSGGTLLHGARLPDEGCGFRRLFVHRDEVFGTDELLAGIVRAAARLASQRFSTRLHDGSNPPLGVGNLASPRGREYEKDPFIGKRFSLSHVSGRSVDLAYFILDRKGKPEPNHETAIGYRRNGWNVSGFRRFYLRTAREPAHAACQLGGTASGLIEWKCFVAKETYRFDDERNWALVRELLLDPEIGVIEPASGRVRPKDQGIRRILVSSGLRDRLLSHGLRNGDSKPFVELAAAVLKQPSNALPHDDHLHIDLNCAPEDVRLCACENTGVPPRPHVGRRLISPRRHR